MQFSTLDEYRYHEALVAPVMNGPRSRVLILGGGDGLAAARVLKYPGVQQVTLVDLDPAVVRLARTRPEFLAANDNSMNDPRMNYIAGDAFNWLRTQHGRFDVVAVDPVAPGHPRRDQGVVPRVLNGQPAQPITISW